MIRVLQGRRVQFSTHLLHLIGLITAVFLAAFGAYAQSQQPPPTPQPQQTDSKPPLQNATQEPQQQHPKIALQVNTVSVLATVHDKHSKIVSNLSKDDFSLEEDGRPQTINYFARESDLALCLGLLVDTSLSQRKVLDQERNASYSFLDHLLREKKDLGFVVHFDREVELLQDFTSSRPKLQAALQHLQTPQFGEDAEVAPMEEEVAVGPTTATAERGAVAPEDMANIRGEQERSSTTRFILLPMS